MRTITLDVTVMANARVLFCALIASVVIPLCCWNSIHVQINPSSSGSLPSCIMTSLKRWSLEGSKIRDGSTSNSSLGAFSQKAIAPKIKDRVSINSTGVLKDELSRSDTQYVKTSARPLSGVFRKWWCFTLGNKTPPWVGVQCLDKILWARWKESFTFFGINKQYKKNRNAIKLICSKPNNVLYHLCLCHSIWTLRFNNWKLFKVRNLSLNSFKNLIISFLLGIPYSSNRSIFEVKHWLGDNF